MGQHHHAADTSRTVQELLPHSKYGWNAFTKATLWGCISIVTLLLLMLIFLK